MDCHRSTIGVSLERHWHPLEPLDTRRSSVVKILSFGDDEREALLAAVPCDRL
jgi:hypothetical protein